MKHLVPLLLTAAFCCEAIAQETPIGPDAKTLGCEVCDVLPGPVKIGCQDEKVQVERPKVTLAPRMTISWKAESEGTLWAVTFRRSPCGRHTFDPAHPACEIRHAKPGNYVYTVHLKGCPHTGTGTITVPPPPVKPVP
jgi:hypothetical protein